jgi:hypothetical protein
MNYLVQLLLPIYDNAGRPIPPQLFGKVRAELLERFGGLTTFTRAPAKGLWADSGTADPEQDELVVYEVMVDSLDERWWAEYRETLSAAFAQKELVVRAHPITML